MAAIQYQILTVDLATVRSAPGEALLGVGVSYDAVTVLALPAGATCFLAFGDNKAPIPLGVVGQTFAFYDACDRPYSVDEALRFTNPAGAGSVVILVSIGGQTQVEIQ